jgi:hypothetical protein
MARAVLLTIITHLTLAGVASAQSDFSRLNVKAGDVIYVTDPSGTQVTGRVTQVSAAAVSVDGYQFKPTSRLRIERRGDPVWDGTAIGLAAGFGLGALTAAGECGVDWSFGKCALAGAGWGGLFGLLIDWQHTGRTLVYLGASSVSSPVVTRRGPRATHLTVRVVF